MHDTPEALQLILGTDKGNPCFCLYTDLAEKALHVYYGLELLEVVPNDRDSPAYRLLAARLYNAGVRVATLEGVFGLDRKTMRRWGQALRSGDRDWLAEVLAGRWGRRKFTVEMKSYVRRRWPDLRSGGQRDYRRRLQEELERVFGVRVSGETLRGLLRELRGQSQASPTSGGGRASGVASAESGEGAPGEVPATKVERDGWAVIESTAAELSPDPAAALGGEVRVQEVAGVLATEAEAGGNEPNQAPNVAVERSGQALGSGAAAQAVVGADRVVPRVPERAADSSAAGGCASSVREAVGVQVAVATPKSDGPAEGGSPPVAPLGPGATVAPPGAAVVGALAGPVPEGAEDVGKLAEATCVSKGSAASVLPDSRKLLPPREDWARGQTAWSEHAGLLIFSDALAAVGSVVEPAQPWLSQALGSVLAGALNVEQTKYLNVEDLELLLGEQVRGLGPQRSLLKELAAGPGADALLSWNGQRVGAAAQSDFYFDPHTKHYTGMAEVLKGWCSAIRWADKALHSDFLHTVGGQPIYFECTDNYEDLRTRLWGVVGRAREALGWPKDKVLSLVIDRAVFGQPAFERVLAEPALHLITWQKGYERGGWDEAKVSGQCVLQRARNHAADLQSYQFRYLDQKWATDPRWRQLIVRATNPWGRTVEVAILTDDFERPAVEVVRLMFGRWVQENDFKYLDQHFGINQITSYGVVDYAQLKGQLTDRQVENGEYRALLEEARQVRAQAGRLLWAERQAEQRQAASQARQAELELRASQAIQGSETPDPAVEAEAAARQRELSRLKAGQARRQATRAERQEKLQTLEQRLAQLTGQAAQTQQTVSRLENLITRQMVRLETGPKRLLDAIKIVARNEFYRALKPFRAAYDNYRDDHEHFRRLTQSPGVLRWSGQQLEVHLLPAVPYGPTLRRVWDEVLAGVNAAGPVWPDGSGRRLWFRLAARAELQVSLRAP